jgi:hypothetical protein
VESALLPEDVTAAIAAHEKPRITHEAFSDGTSTEMKRAALTKVK